MDPLFQVLVRNSPDAVAMLDADGTIRFASDSSAQLLGYSLEERMGRSAFELMHPDVTDRLLAEEALRVSEERLRHIVEQSQDLIYDCDAEGRFTYVNPTAARVMRYAEHELI